MYEFCLGCDANEKKEWMLLALALIIGAIIVVISIIVFAWQQQGQSKLNKKEEPVLPEVEEIVYDPVEADQWFEIERLF